MAKLNSMQTTVITRVERKDGAITVPDGMKLEDAIKVLQTQQQYEEQEVQRVADLEGHPFDVAHAFGLAIAEICGTTLGKPIESFFGEQPPTEISVEVGPGEFVKVLWGQIVFPFDPKQGTFHTHFALVANGEVIGRCIGSFKQKYQPTWDAIIQLTREYLLTKSIFKGRTLRVQFMDQNGRPHQVPEIKPWDVSKMDVSHLCFSQALEQQIEDHILTPIKYREACEQAGTPFKRGILLTGPYGTGKTLLAAAVAKEGAARGITVIYIENVKELAQAIRMGMRLAPTIVFGEDIDRVTDDERDHDVDMLLNTLDGVDTKHAPVMTILTSNYADRIYKGMIRPGRIDVALSILPPDSVAAARLVKSYLGDMFLDQNGNLEEMGNALTGMIPAVIREICERSKLSHISRTGKAPVVHSITPDDVLRATASMKAQVTLLNDRPETPTEAQIGAKVFTRLLEQADTLKALSERVDEVYDSVNE